MTKNILLAIAVLAFLPALSFAEEKAAVHTMQNSNPAPATPAQEPVKESMPEHVMNNSNPSPKAQEKAAEAPEHVMKNK